MRIRNQVWEPLLSAVLVIGFYCLQAAARGVFPFGHASNQVNDLSSQFVPFAAEYRRLLTGQTELTSLTWTWAAGAGVPFHGDYATYLSNPLLLLLPLFPQSQIELAMWVITTLMLGLSGLTMAILLRRLSAQGGSFWLVALSVGYGLSAWAVNDGDYVPIWMSTYVMFPLVILAAKWASEGKYFVRGALIVALMWWANYYTAYMASLGVALILVIMLLAEAPSWGHALRTLGRFALQGFLGVLLCSILIYPTYRQVGLGTDVPSTIPANYSPAQMLSHLFPMTEAISSAPSFYVGSLALVLALMLIGAQAYSRRFRAAWLAGTAGVMVSMSLAKPLWVWNVFDSPNGNIWRAAFVVCALLVIVAWYAASQITSVNLWGLGAAIAGVAVVAYCTAAGSARSVDRLGYLFAALSLALVIGVVAGQNNPRVRLGAQAILALCVAVELPLSTAFTLTNRDSILPPHPLRTGQVSPESDSAWPTYRSAFLDPSGKQFLNGGLYWDLPVTTYYSSLIPQVTSSSLTGELGVSRNSNPRFASFNNLDKVPSLILSVRNVVNSPQPMDTAAALPFVRELPEAPARPELPAAFALRQQFFQTQIYLPATPGQVPPGAAYQQAITCPAGTYLAADLRNFEGELNVSGKTVEIHKQTWLSDSPAADKPLTIAWQPAGSGEFACLDEAALQREVAAIQVPEINVTPGEVSAHFAKGIQRAVIATTAVVGWDCGKHPVSSTAGLLTVDLGGDKDFTCTYRVPGRKLGAAGSGAAGLALAAIGGWQWRRRRGAQTPSITADVKC